MQEEPSKWRTEVPVKIDELGSKKEARTGQFFFFFFPLHKIPRTRNISGTLDGSCSKEREGEQAEEKGRKTEEKRMAKQGKNKTMERRKKRWRQLRDPRSRGHGSSSRSSEILPFYL